MPRTLQLLFCMILILPGCKREEPNPELLDPIYTDVQKQLDEDEGRLAAEKKALEKSKEDQRNAEPNTLDLKNAQRAIAKSNRIVHMLEQKIIFDKIRSRRRLAEDHLNYHNAFVAGKEWPDKSEYAAYLVNQRLENAPRNWDARVPKLFSRKPAAAPSKKKEPAAE